MQLAAQGPQGQGLLLHQGGRREGGRAGALPPLRRAQGDTGRLRQDGFQDVPRQFPRVRFLYGAKTNPRVYSYVDGALEEEEAAPKRRAAPASVPVPKRRR